MALSIDRHIEITPGVRGGKPRIAGTRIAVIDIATLYLRLGQSIEEIAGEYDLSLASVYAAMAYYYDHRAEIDQRMADDEQFAEEYRRDNPHVALDISQTLNRD